MTASFLTEFAECLVHRIKNQSSSFRSLKQQSRSLLLIQGLLPTSRCDCTSTFYWGPAVYKWIEISKIFFFLYCLSFFSSKKAYKLKSNWVVIANFSWKGFGRNSVTILKGKKKDYFFLNTWMVEPSFRRISGWCRRYCHYPNHIHPRPNHHEARQNLTHFGASSGADEDSSSTQHRLEGPETPQIPVLTKQ